MRHAIWDASVYIIKYGKQITNKLINNTYQRKDILSVIFLIFGVLSKSINIGGLLSGSVFT